MSDIVAKLGAFAASKDSRLACAAAVILAELAPRDAALVRQLSEALNDADPIRRPFLIEALGRIGTADAAAALSGVAKAILIARAMSAREFKVEIISVTPHSRLLPRTAICRHPASRPQPESRHPRS